MRVTWDKDMFNMFGKKDYVTKGTTTDNDYVDFVPEVKAQEKPPVTYYTLGITSENRVELRIGYASIAMNKRGLEDLINQLEVFHDSLNDENPTKEETNESV